MDGSYRSMLQTIGLADDGSVDSLHWAFLSARDITFLALLAPLNFTNSASIQMLIILRKLVIIGDGACGKTSLLSVFTLGYFPTVSKLPITSLADC